MDRSEASITRSRLISLRSSEPHAWPTLASHYKPAITQSTSYPRPGGTPAGVRDTLTHSISPLRRIIKTPTASHRRSLGSGCWLRLVVHPALLFGMQQLPPNCPIFLPESLIDPRQVDGSLFIYFDSPIILPAPPLLILPVVGQFLERMLQSHWWPQAQSLLHGAADYKQRAATMREVLDPLQGSAFIWILMVYPAEVDQFDSATSLLRSGRLRPESVLETVDSRLCAAELLRHLGAMCASSHGVEFAAERAESLIQNTMLRESLAAAALIRLSLVHDFAGEAVVLSNPRLVQTLGSLEVEPSSQPVAPDIGHEAVAWEIFRQLLHAYTHPLTPEVAERMATIRQDRLDAAKRLRARCLDVARTLGEKHDAESITATAQRLICERLQDDVASVLTIDRKAVRKLIDQLLSNDKVWIGVSGILSVLAGVPPIVAGASGLALVATFGAEAYKQSVVRREKLQSSPFTLLYDLEKGSA